MEFGRKLGIWRSRLIYDLKPFNRRRLKRFYSQFVREGSLCFDLGAHTGNRTKAWLSLGARVIAIEPQPAFVDLLRKKFNEKAGVEVLPLAVGKERGRARLRISSRFPTVSTLSGEWMQVIRAEQPSVQFDRSVEVEVTTLDSLIARIGEPDFVKIDVEGMEEEVLLGLSRPLKALSFEFFPTTIGRAVNCIDILEKKAGYEYNWSLIEKLKFKDNVWVGAEEMRKKLRNYDLKRSGDVYARKF